MNTDCFKVRHSNLEFSLSGVQNKVQQYYTASGSDTETAAYALRCISNAILSVTSAAMEKYPNLPIVFSGGVASNTMLRHQLAPLNPIFAEPQYSTDNAVGVAVLTSILQEA